MRIAVMGAGAVGSYFGAMLARAGHPVVLVGRAHHVKSIGRHGLRIEAKSMDVLVPIEASADPAAIAGADVVLVCVKSGNSEAAGRALLPHLRQDAVVLSLQNGVDNPERLEAAMGRPVVPVAVYVATELAGPGHVKHHGRGDLVIGPSSASEDIAAAFTAAGVPTTVSATVMEALWQKLIVNCCYNAFSAIAQLPYGRFFEVAEVKGTIEDIVAEGIAVARASGISIGGDVLGSVLAIAGAMPGQYSSTAQDLARGKPSEIDFLNGFVVRKGAALGIATPANRALLAAVKLIEAKGKGT